MILSILQTRRRKRISSWTVKYPEFSLLRLVGSALPPGGRGRRWLGDDLSRWLWDVWFSVYEWRRYQSLRATIFRLQIPQVLFGLILKIVGHVSITDSEGEKKKECTGLHLWRSRASHSIPQLFMWVWVSSAERESLNTGQVRSAALYLPHLLPDPLFLWPSLTQLELKRKPSSWQTFAPASLGNLHKLKHRLTARGGKSIPALYLSKSMGTCVKS